MNLLPITLNEEQLADVKRMAALGYRAADMAAALELDHEQPRHSFRKQLSRCLRLARRYVKASLCHAPLLK